MAKTGLFLARLEDRDWKFLQRLRDPPPFDGAIVKASYLAPYPDGDSRCGEPADRLVAKLEEKEWAWALDPATAPHGHHRAAEWASPRARNCTLAQTAPLPWTPETLNDPEVAGDLIDRAVDLQLTCPVLVAPYLEVAGVEDPRAHTNCTLLSLAAERAADQRVAAYLQTTVRPLLDGSAAAVAERCVEAGAETVFIRIRNFKSERLEHVLAYLDLVERINHAGARAVADSAGYFGAVAVAGGAHAFSAGARHFRKVPDALLQRPSESTREDGEASGGGRRLLYESPGELTGVPPNEAGSHLPACYEPDCPAGNGKGKPHEIRGHNLHELRRLARQAAAEGPDFAKRLRAIGRPETQLWAEALERVAQQRAA